MLPLPCPHYREFSSDRLLEGGTCEISPEARHGMP
jgi:hypothetical protein